MQHSDALATGKTKFGSMAAAVSSDFVHVNVDGGPLLRLPGELEQWSAFSTEHTVSLGLVVITAIKDNRMFNDFYLCKGKNHDSICGMMGGV